MTIRRRCNGAKLQERSAVSRTPAVRRDVARQAVPHARQTSSRFRGWSQANSVRSSRWRRRATGNGCSSAKSRRAATRGNRPVDRLRSAPKSPTCPTFLDAYLERCVKPAGLRSISSVRSQIAVLKEHLGNLPLSALEGSGRDQPVQDRLGLRGGRRDRVGPPGVGAAARGDQLGDGADAAAVRQVSVSPLRRSAEQEGGNRP